MGWALNFCFCGNISGSLKGEIPEGGIALRVLREMKFQSMTYDFLFDKQNKPVVS